jgi:hypothetical protein
MDEREAYLMGVFIIYQEVMLLSETAGNPRRGILQYTMDRNMDNSTPSSGNMGSGMANPNSLDGTNSTSGDQANSTDGQTSHPTGFHDCTTEWDDTTYTSTIPPVDRTLGLSTARPVDRTRYRPRSSSPPITIIRPLVYGNRGLFMQAIALGDRGGLH